MSKSIQTIKEDIMFSYPEYLPQVLNQEPDYQARRSFLYAAVDRKFGEGVMFSDVPKVRQFLAELQGYEPEFVFPLVTSCLGLAKALPEDLAERYCPILLGDFLKKTTKGLHDFFHILPYRDEAMILKVLPLCPDIFEGLRLEEITSAVAQCAVKVEPSLFIRLPEHFKTKELFLQTLERSPSLLFSFRENLPDHFLVEGVMYLLGQGCVTSEQEKRELFLLGMEHSSHADFEALIQDRHDLYALALNYLPYANFVRLVKPRIKTASAELSQLAEYLDPEMLSYLKKELPLQGVIPRSSLEPYNFTAEELWSFLEANPDPETHKRGRYQIFLALGEFGSEWQNRAIEEGYIKHLFDFSLAKLKQLDSLDTPLKVLRGLEAEVSWDYMSYFIHAHPKPQRVEACQRAIQADPHNLAFIPTHYHTLLVKHEALMRDPSTFSLIRQPTSIDAEFFLKLVAAQQ